MEKEKLNHSLIIEVEREARRFLKAADAVHDRYDMHSITKHGKETAALKRAALDLKNQLTRITQSKIY